jgi:hypothetical protein
MNREASLRRVPSSLKSSDGSWILSNLGSRCSGHVRALDNPVIGGQDAAKYPEHPKVVVPPEDHRGSLLYHDDC